MATAKQLLSIVGKPIARAAFRTVVAADNLKSSKEPDLNEGQPVAIAFACKKAGYQISTEGGRVVAVFLYVEPKDGFVAFPGALPCGLQRGATRAEVRRLMGKPQCSGKAYDDKLLGPQGAWDRFLVESRCIHIEYTVEGPTVGLVTLMAEEDAP